MRAIFPIIVLSVGLVGCATSPMASTPVSSAMPVAPDGYEVRPAIVSPGHPSAYDVVETPETRLRRENTEAQKRRADYVASTPQLTPAIREAILSGRLAPNMLLWDAEAAIGPLQKVSDSDGVGGSLVVWVSNPGHDSTYLYFENSRLSRWTTTPNY